MSISEVIQIALSILGCLGLYILNDLKKAVNEATKSVGQLNTKVGVIIEKTERHDKEIDDMKEKQEQARERIHELASNMKDFRLK